MAEPGRRGTQSIEAQGIGTDGRLIKHMNLFGKITLLNKMQRLFYNSYSLHHKSVGIMHNDKVFHAFHLCPAYRHLAVIRSGISCDNKGFTVLSPAIIPVGKFTGPNAQGMLFLSVPS